ncbi:MAG: nucleotidyltransferase domain-containing protein [Candidatus Caldarchaeum sp.]|nr:nucleotidyltransferase domain-containing protein [Candidatus Caldarchaeum sp.]
MAGKDLIDLLIETRAEKQRYLAEVWKYVGMMKELVKARDPKARVLLFGSFVKGIMRPDSDVDVLIITDEAETVEKRIGLRVEIMQTIGDVTPFEIHLVTQREHKEWYSRFIQEYIEI